MLKINSVGNAIFSTLHYFFAVFFPWLLGGQSPGPKASWISKLTFSWVTPLIRYAFDYPLMIDHVWDLPERLKSQMVEFFQAFKKKNYIEMYSFNNSFLFIFVGVSLFMLLLFYYYYSGFKEI